MSNDQFNFNLPVFTSQPKPHKSLSMDEYDTFNIEDPENCFDREAYLREKTRRVVNVEFVLDNNGVR